MIHSFSVENFIAFISQSDTLVHLVKVFMGSNVVVLSLADSHRFDDDEAKWIWLDVGPSDDSFVSWRQRSWILSSSSLISLALRKRSCTSVQQISSRFLRFSRQNPAVTSRFHHAASMNSSQVSRISRGFCKALASATVTSVVLADDTTKLGPYTVETPPASQPPELGSTDLLLDFPEICFF